MNQKSGTAVAAALAVAREHGVRSDEPVILRDAWHILLHLKPLPIVARVSSPLPYPEGPDPQDLVRELRVASYAASRGAAVVPPSEHLHPGPHERDGHIVTFWRYVEPHPDPDPADAGRALRVIHDTLLDCDAEVPAMSRPNEMKSMLAALPADDDRAVIAEIAARPTPPGGQVLHGDAHMWNCMGSPSGPLWHDFETTCHGRREYDLAALVMRDRIDGDRPQERVALAAYGEHDEALLSELLPIYAAWIAASMLLSLGRRPDLRAHIDTRIEWLRRA